MAADSALILNLDDSVSFTGPAADHPPPPVSINLTHLQERIRYSATLRDMALLGRYLHPLLCGRNLFFLGSGDFHHLSYVLIDFFQAREPLHVVVFDNHPDNMIYPRGIHCGSWVYQASLLPQVAAITVVGIASADLRGLNLLQHRYRTLRTGKVSYWCLAPVPAMAAVLGSPGMLDIRPFRSTLPEALLEEVQRTGLPVYLSLDKDVLSRQELCTTWDQGVMATEELLACLQALAPLAIALDVTGDLSSYRFTESPLKKFLRKLDGPDLPFTAIDRDTHCRFNDIILSQIQGRLKCT